MRRCPLLVLTAVCVPALRAQETGPNTERAADAKLELVRQWKWGADGFPAFPPAIPGSGVGRMAFSRDGSVLAFELGAMSSASVPTVYALELSSSRAKDLVSGDVALLGSSGQGEILLRVGEELRRFDGKGGSEEVADLEVPNRSDAWISPFEPRLLVCGMEGYRLRTELVDLEDGERARLSLGQAHPTAVAWHGDGLLALGLGLFAAAGGETGEGIRVFSADGSERRRWPGSEHPVRAIDFSVDGRSVTWVDDRIRRADVESGEELATAEGRPRFWANVDPVLAISHDGMRLQLWNGSELVPSRAFELEEEDRPDLRAKMRRRTPGVVLSVAIRAKRDLLALATFEGLRLYRIVP